jgi:hypothetical protein
LIHHFAFIAISYELPKRFLYNPPLICLREYPARVRVQCVNKRSNRELLLLQRRIIGNSHKLIRAVEVERLTNFARCITCAALQRAVVAALDVVRTVFSRMPRDETRRRRHAGLRCGVRHRHGERAEEGGDGERADDKDETKDVNRKHFGLVTKILLFHDCTLLARAV